MQLIFNSLLIVGVVWAVVTSDKDKDKSSNDPIESTGQLLNKLFVTGAYDARVAPLRKSQPVNVSLGYSIVHVQNLTKTSVRLSGWFLMNWQDKRLKWDKKEEGIDRLVIDNDQIWLPELSLWDYINSDEVHFMENSKTPVVLTPDTGVELSFPTTFTIPCSMEGKDIECRLIIGSGVRDVTEIDLELKGDRVGTKQYTKKGNCALVSGKGSRKITMQAGHAEPYAEIVYTLIFAHKK